MFKWVFCTTSVLGEVSLAKQLLIQQVGFVNSRHFFQHRSRAKHWYKNLKILDLTKLELFWESDDVSFFLNQPIKLYKAACLPENRICVERSDLDETHKPGGWYFGVSSKITFILLTEVAWLLPSKRKK